jgi:hypothetical protein
MSRVFGVVCREAVRELPRNGRLYLAMDDSLLRKCGTRTYGVGWRRDPLGPPFHTNFIRGQRVLQISLVVPQGEGTVPARLIPVDFAHIPTPPKPRRYESPEVWKQYRRSMREAAISRQGVARFNQLYERLCSDTATRQREPFLLVDGRFTNRNVLKALPTRVRFIGRIRRDAKLYFLPAADGHLPRGRRRRYGQKAPTPEQLRQDLSIPWQDVDVFAAGKVHAFRIKTLAPVLWRPAGADQKLRLVVIAPLGYRPRRSSRVLYRKPAYLITSDSTSDLQDIVQSYVWRWEIEVNLRDEKTLLGVGQAQVRCPASTENVPAMIVAAYAMLLLAGLRCRNDQAQNTLLPPPKWYRRRPRLRTSTQSLRNQLRAELWGKALGKSASHWDKKPEKLSPSLASAVLFAA